MKRLKFIIAWAIFALIIFSLACAQQVKPIQGKPKYEIVMQDEFAPKKYCDQVAVTRNQKGIICVLGEKRDTVTFKTARFVTANTSTK